MKNSLDTKLKTILERFERPSLTISLVHSSMEYCLMVGEAGHKKFGYTGPSLSKLVDEALEKASPELNKPYNWSKIDWASFTQGIPSERSMLKG